MHRTTRSVNIPPPPPRNLRVFDSGPYPESREFDKKGTPGSAELETWLGEVGNLNQKCQVSPAKYSQVSVFVIEEIQI